MIIVVILIVAAVLLARILVVASYVSVLIIVIVLLTREVFCVCAPNLMVLIWHVRGRGLKEFLVIHVEQRFLLVCLLCIYIINEEGHKLLGHCKHFCAFF